MIIIHWKHNCLSPQGKGAAQQVVTSGTLPPVVRDISIIDTYSTVSKLKFAEKTSRLMSPFSKDETGHES